MSGTLCLLLVHDSTELLKQSVARTAGENREEEKINQSRFYKTEWGRKSQHHRLSFPAGGEDTARVDLGRKRFMFVLLDFLSDDMWECCLSQWGDAPLHDCGCSVLLFPPLASFNRHRCCRILKIQLLFLLFVSLIVSLICPCVPPTPPPRLCCFVSPSRGLIGISGWWVAFAAL